MEDHHSVLPISQPDYPYRPPPQSLNVSANISSHANQPVESRSSDCVPRLTLVLIMLFLIMSLIIFIAWLIINPHDPAFHLNSLSVSAITLSHSQFTANYDIEFTINNTNENVNLFIDHVDVVVLYGKETISEKYLEQPILVEKMSQGKLKAEIERDMVHSVKNTVFKDISDDWSKKMVNFNIQMKIRTRFVHRFWPSKEKFIRVSCMSLTVEFISTKGTGKLMSGGKICLIRLA